ncbi:MAG: hypothetical protein E7391_09320 [Ruminococcaceae bacterium]|nr:hypothetical protein [Oscillospiraceae bacterium]
MKKIVSALLCVILIFAMFTGCSKKEAQTLMEKDGKIKIGVLYLAETEDVMEAKKGFEEGIKSLELSQKIEIIYSDAKGNGKILEKNSSDIFDKCDIVVTIGEEASITASRTRGRENAKKPIFFIGVNNPVTTSLMSNTITPSKNITGVMSNVTPDFIFSYAFEINNGFRPDGNRPIRKVGIIYNTSEINPVYEINELKDYLNSNSIKYFEGIIANGFDAQQMSMKIVGEKIPKLDGSGETEEARTIFVISGDSVSLKSLESINQVVEKTDSYALVLGEAELPGNKFYNVIPDYFAMGYQCPSLINDYINGIEMAAISAESSLNYKLFGLDEEGNTIEITGEANDTTEENTQEENAQEQ